MKIEGGGGGGTSHEYANKYLNTNVKIEGGDGGMGGEEGETPHTSYKQAFKQECEN